MVGEALFSSTRLGVCSNARDDWQTPQVVLDVVEAVDTIWLDPCHAPGCLVRAANKYTLRDDGLTQSWLPKIAVASQLVYVNPPYGQIKAWAEKMLAEAEAGAEIIALVPVRTDARWMRPFLLRATIAFWHGRLRFVGAPSSAPFPSALIYLGRRHSRFAVACQGKATAMGASVPLGYR